MESEALRTGMRVRANAAAKYRPDIVGTVTQVYGHRSYRAAEVRFDNGRSALFWHYQIDLVDQPD